MPKSSGIHRSDAREKSLDRYVDYLQQSNAINENAQRMIPKYDGRNAVSLRDGGSLPIIMQGSSSISLDRIFPASVEHHVTSRKSKLKEREYG